MQQGDTSTNGEQQRQGEGEQTEYKEATAVALDTFHVHLKRGEKHDVI